MVQRAFYVEKLSGFFILLWGWKRSLCALVSGAISALSMPPFDLFWVLFITFPILVWLIDGTAADPARSIYGRLKPSFITGWWFAFGYFVAGFWWIGAALLVDINTFGWLLPLAVVGIPAFLALFWAVAIALARIFWSEGWRRIVMLSLAVALAEYARGTILTGFPWNNIGYAAMTNPMMMQSVSVLGLYGITPLAILVFASPAIFAPRSGQHPRRVRALLVVCLGLVLAHVGFGYWRLQSNPVKFVPEIKLRIIQPAIAQKDKWLPENEAEIFKSYLSLSSDKNDEITHYIWPESAFPFVLTERRDALAAIANMLPQDTYLITGAMRIEAATSAQGPPKVFNSVYVINHEGEIVGAADKLHLVPFGEYLPFQEYIESLGLQQLTGIEGGFNAGSSRKILTTKTTGGFLPLICYEIIFPGQILPRYRKDGQSQLKTATSPPPPKAEWIVNITNDAWFGTTSGPYQHQRQAVIRGVEEGLPVIRAANSGISSVSDPFGRIHGILSLGERGSLDAGLPVPAAATLYQQYRNSGFFLIFALLFIGSAWRPRR